MSPAIIIMLLLASIVLEVILMRKLPKWRGAALMLLFVAPVIFYPGLVAGFRLVLWLTSWVF